MASRAVTLLIKTRGGKASAGKTPFYPGDRGEKHLRGGCGIRGLPSQVALEVKNPQAIAGDMRGGFRLGREALLEEGMATDCSILA